MCPLIRLTLIQQPSIDRDGGDFVIDVARKTVHNQDIPTDIMFSNSLNNELRAIMRSLGLIMRSQEGIDL